MQPRSTSIAAFATAILCAQPGVAQPAGAPAAQQARTRGGTAQVRSPEIAPERTVTFRLSAPNATSVLVRNTSGAFLD